MAVREERSDATSRGNPLLSFAREHIALLAPFIGALMFALRCLAVSRGDPYVASMLAVQTSIGDAVRALLLAVIPLLMLFVFWAAVIDGLGRVINGRWREPKALGLLVISPVPPLGFWYFRSWYFTGPFSPGRAAASLLLLGWLVSLPFVFVLGLAAERGYLQEQWREVRLLKASIRLWNVLLPVTAVLALGATLASKNFWLPPERLSFQNEAPFTGYVLKASDDHLIILN